MNIENLIQGIETGLVPYLDIAQINVSFNKHYDSRSHRNQNPDIDITIFYSGDANNFSKTFYGWNPKPKSLKEIVSGILEAANEQKVPLRKPVKNKVTLITNPEVL